MRLTRLRFGHGFPKISLFALSLSFNPSFDHELNLQAVAETSFQSVSTGTDGWDLESRGILSFTSSID